MFENEKVQSVMTQIDVLISERLRQYSNVQCKKYEFRALYTLKKGEDFYCVLSLEQVQPLSFEKELQTILRFSLTMLNTLLMGVKK